MKNMKAMITSVPVLFFSSFAMAATVYVATPENGGSDRKDGKVTESPVHNGIFVDSLTFTRAR